MEFSIEWAGSPNYRTGTRQKIAIVNHCTSGNMPGCLEWMQNATAKASANYLVTKAGCILQLVKDADKAYAQGDVNHPNWPLYDGTNPNNYCLSIEHESFDGSLTEMQYQATLWLHRQLVAKFGIPVDEDHVIGHYRINSIDRPDCPGPKFPWKQLFSDLRGGKQVAQDWQTAIIQEAVNEGLITQPHDPVETASVWFVLAAMLNLLRKIRDEIQELKNTIGR
jgi:N-acetyl-anhydromuramyl-L-alanine amidase AmpD